MQKASRDIAFANGHLSGAGGDFLLSEFAHAQFVLIGESHYDHDTPLFADALYQDLHAKFGFHHLVVEQDSVGMEMLETGVRGNASALAAIARRDPYLVGFASDQDLQFLADVARLEKDPIPSGDWNRRRARPAISRNSHRLRRPRGAHGMRVAVEAAADRRHPRSAWKLSVRCRRCTRENDRAARAVPCAARLAGPSLLDALVKSAEIYSYYRRAEKGEFVGLYNNTVREAWFKQRFLDDYRRSANSATPCRRRCSSSATSTCITA